MPRNRPINVGWWNTLAHAILGIQGEDPIPEAIGYLHPSADLGRLRPEWMFPAGYVGFKTDALSQPAVAGQFSAVGIWNPPDSGWCGVIEEINLGSGSNDGQICVGAVLAVPGAVTAVQIPRDTRWLTPAAALPLTDTPSRFTSIGLRIFNRANAVQITGNVKSHSLRPDNVAGNWNMFHGLWQVLGPGGLLAVESEVVNNAIQSVVFIGYAFPLHKGQRA